MKKIILLATLLSGCATMNESQTFWASLAVIAVSNARSHQGDALIQQQQLLSIQNNQQLLMNQQQQFINNYRR